MVAVIAKKWKNQRIPFRPQCNVDLYISTLGILIPSLRVGFYPHFDNLHLILQDLKEQ